MNLSKQRRQQQGNEIMAKATLVISGININNHSALSEVLGDHGIAGCFNYIDDCTIETWCLKRIEVNVLNLSLDLHRDGFKPQIKITG